MAAENRAIWVNQQGTWKKVTNFSVNQGGNWVPVSAAYYNDNGIWKQFYPSGGVVNALGAGTYNWLVPPGVTSVTVDLVGGGGGGGTGEEVNSGGAGGGGGSGGYQSGVTFPTVPGETLTIQVGAGGAGGLTSGRGSTAGGSDGGTTSITGSQGTLTATGGTGALAGGDSGQGSTKNQGVVVNVINSIFGGGSTNPPPPGVGGLGGTGGYPNGANGVTGDAGQSDGASGNGGAGGSTPFGTGGPGGIGGKSTQATTASTATGSSGLGYGSGGGGAGFQNAVNPLGWSGGNGQDGGVQIRWNNGLLSTFLQPSAPAASNGTIIPNQATLTPSVTTASTSANNPTYAAGVIVSVPGSSSASSATNSGASVNAINVGSAGGTTSSTTNTETGVSYAQQIQNIADAIKGLTPSQIAAYMDKNNIGPILIAAALGGNFTGSQVQAQYNSVDPKGLFSTASGENISTTIQIDPPSGNSSTEFTISIYNGFPNQTYSLQGTASPPPDYYTRAVPGATTYPLNGIIFNDGTGAIITDATGYGKQTITGYQMTLYQWVNSRDNETINITLSPQAFGGAIPSNSYDVSKNGSTTVSILNTINSTESDKAIVNTILNAITGKTPLQIAQYMDASGWGPSRIAQAIGGVTSAVQAAYNAVDPTGPWSTVGQPTTPTPSLSISPSRGDLSTPFTITISNTFPNTTFLVAVVDVGGTWLSGQGRTITTDATGNASTGVTALQLATLYEGLTNVELITTFNGTEINVGISAGVTPIQAATALLQTSVSITCVNSGDNAPANSGTSGTGGDGGYAESAALAPIPFANYSQTNAYWDKTSRQLTPDPKWRNWGILRSVTGVPVAGWGADGTTDTAGTVTVPVSGKNVDVVILDSGTLNPNHPEFAVNANGSGGSRAVTFNWFVYNEWLNLGTNSQYSDTSYNTYDANHAAHCAGIAAGNTYGWARSANIYSINYAVCPGGNSATGFANAFDYVRAFHVNKPVNPATNRKNPTIISCSDYWQHYENSYANIVTVNYRGTTYSAPPGGFTQAQLLAAGILDPLGNSTIRVDQRNATVDAAVARCIAAGVTVVSIAGNYGSYIDVPSGPDYNNYFIDNTGAVVYYHQGSSPGAAPGVICVGNMNSTVVEQKTTDSGNGPRVDVFAPGTSIISSLNTAIGATQLSTINAVTGTYNLPTVQDPRNPAFYVGKDSGTSMACPQVAGYLACMLEKYPTATPTQLYSFVANAATTGQLTSTTAGYGLNNDLNGAPNQVLRAAFT